MGTWRDNYLYLLSLPKWKNKRNEIFKRDSYKCTCCGADRNLVVHHTFYYKEVVNPWQYPSDSLLTLCRKCHDNYHLTHENIIKDKPFHKKKRNKKKKDREFEGIRYPKYLSLAGKVEYKKKWLEKRKNNGWTLR
jgi:5-methylcytosine-specific restriction endonuclease McrA